MPAVFLPLGIIAGSVATLGMDAVMARLPEGATPPRVAASVLTSTAVEDAPERLATFVHYFAGAGTGALYLWLLLVAETVVGVSPLVTVAVSAAFLYVSMVAFFAFVPLPLSDGLSEKRRRRTVRDWTVCAAVYVVVVAPATLVLSAAVSAV